MINTKQFQVDTGGTLTTGLVSYYKLEDATDFFGSNTLTATGAVTYTSGFIINAGNFASGKYLSVNSFDFSKTQPFSINGWVKRTSTGAGAAYARWDDSVGQGYAIYWNPSDTLTFLVADPGHIASAIATGTNTSASYQMLTVTYDGNSSSPTLKIYVNNSLIGQTLTSTNLTGSINTAQSFELGNYFGNTRPLSGQIDEVGIWTKVLSSQEITDLYNGGAGQTMITPASAPTRRIKGIGISR